MIAPKPGRLGRADRLVVDQDDVAGFYIDGRAIELFAIELHPAFADQPLGVAARAYSGASQRLGDTLAFKAACIRLGGAFGGAMFAAIYKWRVLPGREAEFEEAWRLGTIAIRDQLGGWGSRLHRAANGEYFAYAQWPDEDDLAPGGRPAHAL